MTEKVNETMEFDETSHRTHRVVFSYDFGKISAGYNLAMTLVWQPVMTATRRVDVDYRN